MTRCAFPVAGAASFTCSEGRGWAGGPLGFLVTRPTPLTRYPLCAEPIGSKIVLDKLRPIGYSGGKCWRPPGAGRLSNFPNERAKYREASLLRVTGSHQS
jgi:hypothetical protein